MQLRKVRVLAFAIAAFCAGLMPAGAQITTGNISGTVKDTQGGVIPGATVVLDERSRAAPRSAPVVTNETGDVRVAERDARRLHRRSHDGFVQDRQARPASGSAAATASACRRSSLEAGGVAETVNVSAEALLVQSQSAERSFAVSSEQIENLPINRQNFTNLMAFAPGVKIDGVAARPGSSASAASSQNNLMMDGISAMDTGNNGTMLAMNIESIGEVKILTQGYQAEYGRSSGLQVTAVTKSGTNRFRGSGLRRRTRHASGTRTAGSNQTNGDAKPINDETRLGLLARRSDRQARRQQQAVLLLQPRVPSAEPRRSTTATRSGCACRPRPSGNGDFSQSLDNNGALIPQLFEPGRPPAVSEQRDSGERAVCARSGGAQPLSAAQPNADADHELQLRDPAAAGREPDAAAGDPPRLPAQLEAAV